MNKYIKVIYVLILALVSSTTYADTSVGKFANDLTGFTAILNQFMVGAAVIFSIMCLGAAIIRYREHRRNPLAMPLSKVVLLVIIGLLFIGFVLVNQIFFNGVELTFS